MTPVREIVLPATSTENFRKEDRYGPALLYPTSSSVHQRNCRTRGCALKAASSAAAAPPGACPTDPSKPLLEPEALQDTRTEFLDPSTPSAH